MDEEQHVAAWMARLAAAPLPAPRIADAETIWWQAMLERERAARQRAERPIEVMERIQLAAAAAIAVAAFIWALPSLEAAIKLSGM
jgi:hypothetical protein